jgi:predicted nuclease with TOPRIM domain
MSNDKIEKGKHILRMKIASGKHLENPDWDLMKIPLEALHSAALQQIGEQEAYIEELESKLKALSPTVNLTKAENKRIAEETRREAVIANIFRRMRKFEKKFEKLEKKYRNLSMEYYYSLTMVSKLKEALAEYQDIETTK